MKALFIAADKATDENINALCPDEYKEEGFCVRIHFPDDDGEQTLVMFWDTSSDEQMRLLGESADVLFQVAVAMKQTSESKTKIITTPSGVM